MNSSRKIPRCESDKLKNTLCYHFERGYCRFGNKCRFRHGVFPNENSSTKVKSSSSRYGSNVRKSKDVSKGKTCGICFEEVISKKKGSNKFGILPNCKHCFCFPCIKIWRSSIHFEDEVTKSCPECRINSNYVYKNSFWVDNEDKDKFIEARNKKLANIDCKYFRGGKGVCRLGRMCLFRHKSTNSCLLRDRESYIFEEDDDSSMIRLMLFEDSLTDDDYTDYQFEGSYSDDVELEALYLLEEIL